jgi:serine O-acetyltransferase
MLFLDDLRAKQTLYAQGGATPSLLKVLMSDGSLANFLYRMQERLSRLGLGVVALLPHLLNKWLNGCVIGVGARFGPGFVLIHPVGVVINSSVRGGRNVWLESSVVIGENRGGFPVLHDDIFVGSGAKIIGALQVASHVRIGANAVVTKDCPAGATMLGIPAQAKGRY